MKTYNQMVKIWKDAIEDTIKEVYHYQYTEGATPEDMHELVNDQIWETIDSSEDVIYTYQAQKVSEEIGIYGAFDVWELTGERFENWNQVAFASIYDMIQNDIDLISMVEAVHDELTELTN